MYDSNILRLLRLHLDGVQFFIFICIIVVVPPCFPL